MPTGADGGTMAIIAQFLPFVLIFVLFYFLMIRPQQKRMKDHQTMVSNVKRGDTVVLSNGMIGKVTRVEETEALVEIATGVAVPVVKSMISDVRAKGEPAKVADKSKAAARG